MALARGRRRWLEVFRNPLMGSAPERRAALDDAALFGAHERATKAIVDSERLCERVAATTARQRPGLEGTREKAAELASHAKAIRTELATMNGLLEKLAVIALNAGLEGARSTDAHGRSLSMLSEELRGPVGRGAELVRALDEKVVVAVGAVEELSTRLDGAVRDAQEIGQDSTQLRALVQSGAGSLADLEHGLRRATGLDPEVAKLVSQAGDHAKGLVAALTGLDGRGAGEATRSLAPALAPVLRLLAGMSAEIGAAPDSEPESKG
jgi:methyl-accepting chemotaxis protein